MVLTIIESIAFFVLIALVLHFRVLSRTQLGEREIGPFSIVYTKHVGTTWTIPSKIKEVQKYLHTIDIKTDLYISIYLADPTESSDPIPCIVGAVIDDSQLPDVQEPFHTMTLAPRYVATVASGNRIIGLNKTVVYPQLRAYMNIHGYTNAAEEFIEFYHMGKNNSFGKGFYTEVCTRVRPQTEEELRKTEEYENRGMDAASLLFGGKKRFGKK
jgi:hypothetical protein